MKRIMCVLAMVLLFPSSGECLQWTTEQITRDALWDGVPDISGDNIVWQFWDGNDYEGLIYNGSGIQPLTDNDFDDTNFDIGGNLSVWAGNNSIYVNDGHQTTLLQANAAAIPVASYDNIFWSNINNQIFHYDGTTVHDLGVSGGTGAYIGSSNIYANTAAWNAIDGEIYYYEGQDIRNLSHDPGNIDFDPTVYQDQVLWSKRYSDNNGSDIFLYNTTANTLTNLTHDPSIHRFLPITSGNVVVWGENGHLVYYNLATGIKAATSALGGNLGYDLKLVGDLLIGYNNDFAGEGLWHEDLLAFDGEKVYTLADGNITGAIQGWDGDGNTIVWDFMPDGAASREIFCAHIVPEPVSSVLALLGGGAMFSRRRFKSRASPG